MEEVSENVIQNKISKKNPNVALILSLILSGLGQFYNGQYVKGILLLFAELVGFALFIIPGIIVWLFGMYDAYTSAKKINSEMEKNLESQVM
jgi:TM2 domain-containing membrane protein YozV